jgi:PAS domain S-box-containing protein
MLKRLSIANKLFFAFLALTIIVITIASIISFQQSRNSLRKAAFDQLTSVREMKAFQIEDYLEFISKQVVTFSADRMIIDAMSGLKTAFHNLESELAPDADKILEIDRGQKRYYENEFLTRLAPNLQHEPNVEEYLPRQLNTRLLQDLYVSGNPNETGSKDGLDDAGDGSTYSAYHSEVHPVIRDFLKKFGYYDIFLLDINHGEIVYSVFKEVDVGTSLMNGPYADTGLARVFRAARNADTPDFVAVDDFESYHPSYNAPAAFIASPIFDETEMIGVLAFQMPIDRINLIMTNDQNWSEVGLGESGETYIVADDFRLRNQSRFLIEDSENYFLMIERMGTPAAIIEQVRNLNSTIGLQEVRTEGTRAALAGQSDTRIFDDYRGVPVLSSYRPLEIEGLDWVIMSEIDEAEAFAAIGKLARKLILTTAVLLLLALIAAIIFSRTITRPLATLRENSKLLASGQLDVEIDTSGLDEIGALARDFDYMRKSLKKVVDELALLNAGLEQEVADRTAKLESSERRVKSILNNAADGIIVIDEAGIVQVFNPSAESMFGYSAHEVVGSNIRMLMPEHLARDHDAHLKRYGETGKKTIIGSTREIVGQKKDRTQFPIDLHVGEAEVGGEKIFVGVIRDITVRKELEAEIQRQLSFVESLVDTIPNPMFVKGPDAHFLAFNQVYEKVFGMSREDYLGKTVLEMEYLPMEVRKRFHDEDTRMLKNGEGVTRETRIVYDDGEEHDVFYQVKAFNFPNGDRAGLMGILTDITELKTLERQLEQANQRMMEELNFARDIQMGMLPLLFPAFPDRSEVHLDALLEPAREVGGDFYDFYFQDENRLCLIVADVSGKGAPAALYMAVSKTLIKSRATHDFDPSSILTQVNGELAENNTTSTFVTIFLAILDVSNGELVYCNAGHNPPYIKRNSGRLEQLEELHGPILGVIPDLTYTKDRTILAPGDILVMYTDGVTESMNERDEEYTDQRLADLLSDSDAQIPNELTLEILEDVRGHQGDAEQSDDITLLAAQYHGLSPDVGGHLEVRIKNQMPDIDVVEERFHAFSTRNSIPETDRQTMNMVMDDLLNNVISYAYPQGGDHVILVDMTLKGSRLVLMIEDDGIPFNPFQVEEPDVELTVEERGIGGLGIHLVRETMDEYHYQRRANKNIVILVKELSALNKLKNLGESNDDPGND